MEIFILIFLPIALMKLADLYEKITTTPEERAKKKADIEIARALREAQDIKDRKAWQEKVNNEQGWKNEVLDGEFQFMPRLEKEKYLSSDKWKLIRNAVIQRDKSCTACGSVRELNVHHLHYLRLGRENLNDLVTLCEPCHFDLHEKKGYSRQGLYVPEGYKGLVPTHQELIKPRYNEYWTPTGFKTKPEYEKHEKPTVFYTEYEYVGCLEIGAKNKFIRILKEQIEKTTHINLSNTSMAKGHSLNQLNKLKNLKCLELKNCDIKELPNEIGELIHLEVLDLSENHLLSLPDFLGNLTNLKSLILPEKPYLSNLDYISEYLEGLPFLDHQSIKSIKLLSKNETPPLLQTVKSTSEKKKLTHSDKLMGGGTQDVLQKAREEKELVVPKDDMQPNIESLEITPKGNIDKTKKTVKYLNACIQQYSDQIEWWKIIYSLEGWAEHFATVEFDAEVSDYAPKLIEKLEIFKEYIENDRRLFEADIDFLIKRFSLRIEEAKLHLELEPYL